MIVALLVFQSFVFRVVRGPFEESFYQCVTYGAYKHHWQERVYTIVTFALQFFVPLVVTVTAYTLIFTTISKKSREHSGSHDNRDVRFGSHVSQIRPIWDKSGTVLAEAKYTEI